MAWPWLGGDANSGVKRAVRELCLAVVQPEAKVAIAERLLQRIECWQYELLRETGRHGQNEDVVGVSHL